MKNPIKKPNILDKYPVLGPVILIVVIIFARWLAGVEVPPG